MKLLGFVFVGTCLCVIPYTIVESSNFQFRPDPHSTGLRLAKESIVPVTLNFSLYKDDQLIRFCSGAHIQKGRIHKVYWVVPAECLDTSKYDKMLARFGGPLVLDRRAYFFELSTLKYHLHPNYNNVTKEHNIAVVIIPLLAFVDLRQDYKAIELPSSNDTFTKSRALELYEYRSSTNQFDSSGKASLFSVKTKRINSIWCKIFYPFSPIKKYHVCATGFFNKGLSEDDFGTPLVAREGETFKLVGLSTVIRTWTQRFSLPLEFLSVQPYVDWINAIMQGNNNLQ